MQDESYDDHQGEGDIECKGNRKVRRPERDYASGAHGNAVRPRAFVNKPDTRRCNRRC